MEFLEFINGYHQAIKYTWDYSTSKASFFGCYYLKGGGGEDDVCTEVYSKPTDTRYLDFMSCHLRHVIEVMARLYD